MVSKKMNYYDPSGLAANPSEQTAAGDYSGAQQNTLYRRIW